jgi:hypothetical protein
LTTFEGDPAGPDGEHRADEPPKVRRTRGPRKQGAHSIGAAKRVSPGPLKAQLEIPYRLAGQIAASRGLPMTGNVLVQKAPDCAGAWDQFLKRWPALYEALEKGMIASDVIVLVMVHLEILQVARMELAARAATMGAEGYNPDANVAQVA